MLTCNTFHKISFIGKVKQRVYAIRFIISCNYKWFIAFHVKRVVKYGSKLFYLCGYILMRRNFRHFDEEIIILNILNVHVSCYACIFIWK